MGIVGTCIITKHTDYTIKLGSSTFRYYISGQVNATIRKCMAGYQAFERELMPVTHTHFAKLRIKSKPNDFSDDEQFEHPTQNSPSDDSMELQPKSRNRNTCLTEYFVQSHRQSRVSKLS